jgi:hypothetical protein
MSDIDGLREHFKETSAFEFDHGVTVYIEPGKRLSWRDTKAIREAGYRIDKITNSDPQTEVVCVIDE